MGSYKIQIFSRTNLAIATKLPYFGNSYGYKRNLPQNNQKNFKFFVILVQLSKISRDFHKNPTDPGNGSGSVRIRQFLRNRIRILLAKKARIQIRIRATLIECDPFINDIFRKLSIAVLVLSIFGNGVLPTIFKIRQNFFCCILEIVGNKAF